MTTLTPAAATALFRDPPARHVDVGDGAVALRTVGRGPDALFVHGWPVSGATWRRLLPSLAPHLTCHVVDLVGSGHSRFDRETRIDLARHVEDVRAVRDALDVDEVAVVGHDSGGLVARHALAGDARVRAMALLDTEQPQGLTWRFAQFLWMARVPGFEHVLAWAAMQRRLRRSPLLLGDCFADPTHLDGEFEELFLAPLREEPLRRWACGELARRFDTRLVGALAEVHARIDVPVQLVWGEADPFFPVARARQMAATFADAALHVVDGAKLFVHEERPAEVARAVIPTLLGERRPHASPVASSP